MNFSRLATATVALVFVAGCAPMDGSTETVSARDGHGAKVPAVRLTGQAQSCIPLAQISESQVRDDWTIDFRTGGNRWYRNTLPYRCNSLGFEKAFSYKTSLSQLCSTDIITVFSSGAGGGPRGSCGLGAFQPVELVK